MLFLSTEDLEGLKLARIESSTIGPEGSDNVLSAALLRSLRHGIDELVDAVEGEGH